MSTEIVGRRCATRGGACSSDTDRLPNWGSAEYLARADVHRWPWRSRFLCAGGWVWEPARASFPITLL